MTKANNKQITIKVPASTSNLGPAFDSIGMAFQLYTTITLRTAPETSFHLSGNNLENLPRNKTNLVYRAAQKIFKEAGVPMPELHIAVKNEIPLTRGLGSSAAAIVGAFFAANRLLPTPFSTEEIFNLATAWEGHPDNVGASLFGGIIVATRKDGNIPYIKFNPPEGLKTVVIIPDYHLPTEDARNVLPDSYSRNDVVHSISHSNLLVAALTTGKTEFLQQAMQDRIHQPHRASLIPGMEEILREGHKHGALGVALSGAGPSIIAFTHDSEASLKSYMGEVLKKHGVNSRSLTLHPDSEGVRLVEELEVIPKG